MNVPSEEEGREGAEGYGSDEGGVGWGEEEFEERGLEGISLVS